MQHHDGKITRHTSCFLNLTLILLT